MTQNTRTGTPNIFVTPFDRLHVDGEPFIPVERRPDGLFLLGEWHPHTGLFLSDPAIRAGLEDETIRIERRNEPAPTERG